MIVDDISQDFKVTCPCCDKKLNATVEAQIYHKSGDVSIYGVKLVEDSAPMEGEEVQP